MRAGSDATLTSNEPLVRLLTLHGRKQSNTSEARRCVSSNVPRAGGFPQQSHICQGFARRLACRRKRWEARRVLMHEKKKWEGCGGSADDKTSCSRFEVRDKTMHFCSRQHAWDARHRCCSDGAHCAASLVSKTRLQRIGATDCGRDTGITFDTDRTTPFELAQYTLDLRLHYLYRYIHTPAVVVPMGTLCLASKRRSTYICFIQSAPSASGFLRIKHVHGWCFFCLATDNVA